MRTYTASIFIDKPVADVFRFVATNYVENHPKWAPHVVEVRMERPGPIAAGTRGHVVRRDRGKIATYEFEVAEYQVDERIAIRAWGGPAQFFAAYALDPVGDDRTRLSVEFGLKMRGLFGMIQPFMAATFRKEVDRVGRAIKGLLEP